MVTKNAVPLILTQGEVVFPNFAASLKYKSENVSEKLINYFKKNNSKVIITSFVDGEINEKYKHYDYGTLAKVSEVKYNRVLEVYDVQFNGLSRVKILKTISNSRSEFLECQYEEQEDLNDWTTKSHEIKKEIEKKLLSKLKDFGFDSDYLNNLFSYPVIQFTYSIASILPLDINQKIKIISENDIEKRLKFLEEIFMIHLDEAKNLTNAVNEKVRIKLTKQQKEFYLKEQLRAIKEELDLINGEENEVESILKKLDIKKFPDHIKDKIEKETKRLENTPFSAPEANIIRTYIDWLLNLPYTEATDEKISLRNVQKILDEDHYGIEKPKERVIEYLAVKKQNPDSKGSIIALVGPPGTGKTSFAQSIARSMGKEFVKISLGGIKDESEIRGHRRTYIAAMPGKIIQAMRKAKVINPVILLDEIDKMSSDFRGDPTSAMLEVLDPEQNVRFQDHYIEEDYDLSHVIFISTANYLENIPDALFDRLEIIEMYSYTELEKIHIAKEYLVKRVKDKTKIDSKYFYFNDETLKYLIRHYTLEAGVRQLQRTLETMARKIIVLKLNKQLPKNFKINIESVTKILGKKRFDFTKKEKKPQIGTTNGLAWTAYGGDILPIEVSMFPGKGDLIITGQLRDVMQESANIALSYIKANSKKYNIPDHIGGKVLFKDFDIHIHSPDGATPKDGPSAGVTFTTSLISAIKNMPISQDVGMTGEITLRGKILPIGGLKEKSISAFRSGLSLIFVPKENEKDLDEIPKEVKDNLKIILVENYDEIYDYLSKEKLLTEKKLYLENEEFIEKTIINKTIINNNESESEKSL